MRRPGTGIARRQGIRGIGGGRPPAAFDPSSISSMTLWLDQRGQSGSPIDVWANQKAGAFPNYTASATERPATGTTIGGYAAPVFDGTNDRMSPASGGAFSALGSVSGYHFMAVLRATAATDSGSADARDQDGILGGNGGGYYGWGPRNNGGVYTLVGGHYDGAFKNAAVSFTIGAATLVEWWFDGSVVRVRAGSAAASAGTAAGNMQAAGGTEVTMLGRNYAATRFFNGPIAALLAFNASLSAANQLACRAYLATKYGVAS